MNKEIQNALEKLSDDAICKCGLPRYTHRKPLLNCPSWFFENKWLSWQTFEHKKIPLNAEERELIYKTLEETQKTQPT